MTIEFVNHASVIFNYEKLKLISDPWLEGAVFDNGWNHLSETSFKYEDFKRITHIWFPHEHPDHFYPPNINKIPKGLREKITVLYRETKDKKVLNYCEKMGFKDVIELPNSTWVEIEGL